MTIANLTQRDSYITGYEYREVIAAGHTGKTVYIPPVPPGKTISVTVIGAGGYIERSTSPDAAVKSENTDLKWHKATLTESETAGTYADALPDPVSSIRGVAAGVDIILEIKI